MGEAGIRHCLRDGIDSVSLAHLTFRRAAEEPGLGARLVSLSFLK